GRAAGTRALRDSGGGREGRYLRHLLHQRGAGAEGESRTANRGTAGRAGGRRRLRAHRSQRRLAAGLPARHVHPVYGRPAHSREARLRRSRSPATLRTIMKINARNRLKGGKIVEVKKGAITANVKIDIGGQTVTARSPPGP